MALTAKVVLEPTKNKRIEDSLLGGCANLKTARLLFCCLLLTGCARTTVDSLPSAASLSTGGVALDVDRNANFSVIHRFDGSDGQWPVADLIDVKGTLYGTTLGNAFKIAPSGKETVLQGLQGGLQAGLIELNGALYGTTMIGGTANCGTVFKLTPSGHLTALHSFTCSPDGQDPEADLIDIGGTFYSTTDSGGANDAGTVFKIAPSGTESIVYSFKGPPDGAEPRAGLLNVNGTLWGTTSSGGVTNNGAVFKITPSGTESIVYSFKGPPDGFWPLGSLVYVDGVLYGTTTLGGDGTACSGGCGTVFKLTPDGTEGVLHSFNGPDGYGPEAGLIDVSGTLYGTTIDGGAGGGGAVFKITTSGVESIVHGFRYNGPDGARPVDRLLYAAGSLYGTTSSGGLIDCGNRDETCGTVFKISL
jgi:uncharacterized repeat protein (TIGR03803 family)